MIKNNLRFDRQFFRDFWQLFKPYWKSEEKWMALGLLALNLFCIITEVRLSVALNNFDREFFDALQNVDKPAIIHSLLNFSVIIILFALALTYSLYFNRYLGIRWQRWLTDKYLKKWLHNHHHYHMQNFNLQIDNPDQRISEDLEKFALTTLSLFSLLFHSILTLTTFGFILWNLGGNLKIPIFSSYIMIPHYLFFGALLYAVMGTYITGRIGKSLATFDYQQQQFNADFRFSLVRLRESSEQIAFYRGEAAEHANFNMIFKRIFSNYINVISVKRNLSIFNDSYRHAISIYAFALSIPLFLTQKIKLGGVMQILSAMRQTVNAFSIFVSSYTMLTDWRATISRLSEFHKSLDNFSESFYSNIQQEEHSGQDIKVTDLTLKLPDEKILLYRMNFSFTRGRKILIQGDSGIGKTTFLRALSGLWPYGEGKILFPKNIKLLILPQRPYLPFYSTLKEALLYPQLESVEDIELFKWMDICGLTKFKDHLHLSKHWSQELSLGEQQRIAFIRAFIYKPDFVFLDEATSALGDLSEQIIYKQLWANLSESTIITISHSTNLIKLHEQIICFDTFLNKTPIHPYFDKEKQIIKVEASNTY